MMCTIHVPDCLGWSIVKAVIVRQAGWPPVCGDFVNPRAGLGEVIVGVTALALSPLGRVRAVDTYFNSFDKLPLAAGVDGVGRLDDGRRVYFLLPLAPFGAMTERTLVADQRWL